jgi:hypothetical protein
MLNNITDQMSVPLCALPTFLHAATQQRRGAAEMAILADVDSRAAPAKVYPGSEGRQEWIVEAPASDKPNSCERKTFNGSDGLLHALEYAHATYGGAIFLAR